MKRYDIYIVESYGHSELEMDEDPAGEWVKWADVHRLIDESEAKIDALMLEHCPDEMTPEQIENWEKHQRPYDSAHID